MADRPMPFSDPMVSALLAGRKTQTRRVLKPQPEAGARFAGVERDGSWLFTNGCFYGKLNPRIKVGDRLWVREAYFQRGHWEPVPGVFTKSGRPKWAFVPADHDVLFEAPATYRKGRHNADPATVAWHKRLGRFMPRQYSRLTLIVEAVKVERLQDISRDDAMAEGIVQTWGDFMGDPPEWAIASINRHGDASGSHIYDNRKSVENFRELWSHINGPGSWEANPWVAAYTFRVIKQNIDQVAA